MKKVISSLSDYHQNGQGNFVQYFHHQKEPEQLAKKIQTIDIKQLYKIYKNQEQNTIFNQDPITLNQFNIQDEQIGYQIISDGKLAIIISATQNMSLLDIDLPSHKCLIQLYCERIASLQRLTASKCGQCSSIIIVILTSFLNHEMITEIFQKNSYYDLQEHQFFFIQQEQLPLFNMNGEILLRTEIEIFEECMGNGFIYLNQILLDTLKSIGITILHLCSIENILCKFGDPDWIGAFQRLSLFVSSKCVKKRSQDEKLGTIGYSQNRGIHLNEIDQNEYGYIGQLLVSLDYAIELCQNYRQNLMSNFHLRKKKCTYYDYNINKIVQPSILIHNALRFEITYADCLSFCPLQQYASFEIKREDEYSPILNSTNENKDTMITAKQSYMERDKRWLIQAGFQIEQECEISANLTYFGENLEIFSQKNQQQHQQLIPHLPIIIDKDKIIRQNRISSEHRRNIQHSPNKYNSQKISVHQSHNQFHYKKPLNGSFNVSMNGSLTSSQTEYRQRLTDYGNRPIQQSVNTYYIKK